MSELSTELRERIENTIRFLSIDAVARANSGHVGAPMGLARAALELWDAHLRFDPQDPRWPLRDRFVLSNGHASMLQYALLNLYGVLRDDDIAGFRTLDHVVAARERDAARRVVGGAVSGATERSLGEAHRFAGLAGELVEKPALFRAPQCCAHIPFHSMEIIQGHSTQQERERYTWARHIWSCYKYSQPGKCAGI